MSNQIRALLLSASLLGALGPLVPASSWADSQLAADGSPCDDSILDVGAAASSPKESKQDIKLTKRWENARTEYERDLDFAAIDKHRLPEDYSPLRDLVEAKYHLAIAEGKLIVPNFDRQAITELQQAQSFLAHALKHADAMDKPKFATIKGKVDHVLKFVSHGGGCWSERLSDAFDNIDNDVEKVLHSS
jgi:hypothetical protein